jgi:hypothetical protein
LIYLLVRLVPFVLYGGAVAIWVYSLASRGRAGAAAAVVSAGLFARWVAGGYRVSVIEGWSVWYLPFFAGVACGLFYATRLARSRVDSDGSLPAPLRALPRSPLHGPKLVRRNVLLLLEFILPASLVLNYCGEYLQRVANGLQTWYLALNTSLDYAQHFESTLLGLGGILLGCVLYESLLLWLPPAESRAHDDRRALLLLPVFLAPWLLGGRTLAFFFPPVPLVQGLAIYFFVVRRSSDPTVGATEPAGAAEALRVADPHEPSLPDLRRRRRYMLTGGVLGALVATLAIASAGQNADALAVAAEQMFFITLPASIPFRAMVELAALYLGGDGAANFHNESVSRLIPFLLAAPIANGLLLGWIVARVREARWLSPGRRPTRGRAEL